MFKYVQSRLIQPMSKSPCYLCREAVLPIPSFPNGRDDSPIRKMARCFAGKLGGKAGTDQSREMVSTEVLFHRRWILEGN